MKDDLEFTYNFSKQRLLVKITSKSCDSDKYVFSCNQTSQLLRTSKVSTRGRQINPFGLPSSRFSLKFVGPQDPTRPSNFSCHKFGKMTFTIFLYSSTGRPIGFRKKLPPMTNVVPLQFPYP